MNNTGVSTASQRLIRALEEANGTLCDDCLASQAGYCARQGARVAARKSAASGLLQRRQGVCMACGRPKTVNSLSPIPTAPTGVPAGLDPTRPWMWEGNVQAQIAEHLDSRGYALHQVVDTASKATGVDIIAKRGGRDIWLTVKGYPVGTAKTSPSTQCRHWFSHAMFDVVRYRTERSDVDLGVGLPDGFIAYLNLAKKAAWLRDSAPFRFFWVAEDGSVREE